MIPQGIEDSSDNRYFYIPTVFNQAGESAYSGSAELCAEMLNFGFPTDHGCPREETVTTDLVPLGQMKHNSLVQLVQSKTTKKQKNQPNKKKPPQRRLTYPHVLSFNTYRGFSTLT